MRIRYSILIPLIVATSSAAFASAPISVTRYLALRRTSATSVPIETLKADAPSYIGKVLEIRGTVSGFSKNPSGCSVIVSTPGKGSFLISDDSVPCEDPGMAIACLVKIGGGCAHSLSDLRMVACTYEADVRRAEEAAEAKTTQAKAARTAAQAQAAAQQSSSAATADSANSNNVDGERMAAIYKNAIKNFNSKLSDSQADKISRSILGFSSHYKVDPRLVCAVILAESHFRLSATSKCGAQGLGQLMPSTAAGMGVNNAYDPVQSVYGSVRYIKGMLDRVSGNKKWESLSWNDLALALAAYNAGPGAVKKHGGIPPYKETRNYVRRVTSIYKQLCGVK